MKKLNKYLLLWRLFGTISIIYFLFALISYYYILNSSLNIFTFFARLAQNSITFGISDEMKSYVAESYQSIHNTYIEATESVKLRTRVSSTLVVIYFVVDAVLPIRSTRLRRKLRGVRDD